MIQGAGKLRKENGEKIRKEKRTEGDNEVIKLASTDRNRIPDSQKTVWGEASKAGK